MNTKTMLVLVLAAVLGASVCGCGDKTRAEEEPVSIVGKWELVDAQRRDKGLILTFTPDGILHYGTDWSVDVDEEAIADAFDNSVGALLGEMGISSVSWAGMISKLDGLVEFKYELLDAEHIRIETSLIMGLLSKDKTVLYELSRDELIFDGNTFARVEDDTA